MNKRNLIAFICFYVLDWGIDMKQKDLEVIHQQLSNRGIRKTPFRVELLGLFFENKHGLSHQDVQDMMSTTKDKVTIYRGLNAFVEKGLIHKVPDINNTSRYAACVETCSDHAHVHTHNHAHFICVDCDNTFCIDSIKLPVLEDTEGFKVTSSKLTLQGQCPDCAQA